MTTRSQRQIDEVRRQQVLCSEAKIVYQASGGFPLNGLRNIAPLLLKAAKPGALLEPDELLHISSVVSVAKNVKRVMAKQNRADIPNLFGIVSNLRHLLSWRHLLTGALAQKANFTITPALPCEVFATNW